MQGQTRQLRHFCKLCRFLCKHHYVNGSNQFASGLTTPADIGVPSQGITLDVGFMRFLCIMLTQGKFCLPWVYFVHFNENAVYISYFAACRLV